MQLVVEMNDWDENKLLNQIDLPACISKQRV
jgi:hypothetical protein